LLGRFAQLREKGEEASIDRRRQVFEEADREVS
jgi:hypothetical protein